LLNDQCAIDETKEKIKWFLQMSLFVENMILYLKDQKNSSPKLLNTIYSFSNIAGYKINLQKSVAFLYTNNEQIEKEYQKTIQFTITSKEIKYLGINLTNDMNDLHQENYKTLKKEIEEDYRICKDVSC
jgi:uncharacterized membrane protein (UPF0182 family)